MHDKWESQRCGRRRSGSGRVRHGKEPRGRGGLRGIRPQKGGTGVLPVIVHRLEACATALLVFVLGGRARADRWKPTARSAVRTDCLARCVRCRSEADVCLVLASETPSRSGAVYTLLARGVKQAEASQDLVASWIALLRPRVLKTGFKQKLPSRAVGFCACELARYGRELMAV